MILLNNKYMFSPLSCERKRVLNGERLLTFAVTKQTHEEAFRELKTDSKVELDSQEYIVTDVEKVMKGKIPVKIGYGQHIFYVDMGDHRIFDSLVNTITLKQALNLIFDGSGWNYFVGDDIDEKKVTEGFGVDNGASLFQKAVSMWNFEYTFDCPNKTVVINRRIGFIVDYVFRFNYNIKTIKLTESTANFKTAIRGFGKQTTTTITEYQDKKGNWILLVKGSKVPKGAKQRQRELKEQVVATYISPVAAKFSPRGEPYGKRWQEDFSDERYTTERTLTTAIIAALRDEIEFTVEMDVLNINEDYQPALGDAILTIHEPLDIDLDTRIMEITDYPFNENQRPKVVISNISAKELQKMRNPNIKIAQLQKETQDLKNSAIGVAATINAINNRVDEVSNGLEVVNTGLTGVSNSQVKLLSGSGYTNTPITFSNRFANKPTVTIQNTGDLADLKVTVTNVGFVVKSASNPESTAGTFDWFVFYQ